MKNISGVLEKYRKAYPNNENAVWCILEKLGAALEKQNAEEAERMCYLLHEEFCGPHFDKELAEEAVSKMYHKSASGEIIRGGRWHIDQVREIFSANKGHFKNPQDNVYDLYVALNAMYNDLGDQFKKDFGGEHEKKLVEYTIEFWFQDDDAPDGKIWRYMVAMQN